MAQDGEAYGLARMTLVALVISVAVLTAHDYVIRAEDQRIAAAVNGHFEFHDQRVERLERKIAELEQALAQRP